jgi:NADPH:quinone reductase-like Zn-dependent oxidoreductase
MQAIRYHDYGGPQALTLEQVPRPQPQADQVLLRVLVAGVNPFDWKLRSGWLKEYVPITLPYTPGVEGAGIVEAVGEDVTTLKPGQAVYGILAGGYAEYALAGAGDVQPKPAHLTFEEAASVAHGALTAWQAVIEDAQVQAGQKVLVHGGAGGVGIYAVQLACWRGAHVIATTSARNLDFARSVGADEVIDYNATAFETVVKDLDVVIDTVGDSVVERSLKVLRPGGVFVTVATFISPDAGKPYGVRTIGSTRAPTDKLRQVTEMHESKQLRPVVGSRFSMAEAPRAHELSETGHGRGRIVLLTA